MDAILTILITIAQITTVYLAARGNRWTWIFSIATGLILSYNFFTDKHFMSFAFQVYSILASIGGVFIWKKESEDNRRTINWGNPLWPLLAVVGIAAATYLFDARVLHSNLPILDCAIFALQAVATYLMVRKDINAWICYLICDAIYIPLGIMGGSYKWLFISACFLITATYGFITFIKAWRNTKNLPKTEDA
jgi:nicotinamide mononucleotide transporter